MEGRDRNFYERGGGHPKHIVWFKIREFREQNRLVAVGDGDFRGNTVVGEHIDQVVAGERCGVPEERTKLSGTRDDVDESEIV